MTQAVAQILDEVAQLSVPERRELRRAIVERPLLSPTVAETREDRLCFRDDSPDGDWSPVQNVTVGP
jgi:hypothetical protein